MQQKLLDSGSLIEDHLRIVNISQRNQNASVLRTHGLSYFLKQGDGREGIGTIANEAIVYKFLQTQRKNQKIHRYLPQYLAYDSQPEILTLEFMADAQDLRKYHLRRGRFPKSIATAMGEALGVLHRVPITDEVGNGIDYLSHITPWIFTIHQPELKLFQTISRTALKLVKSIQQFPNLCLYLDILHQQWNAVALIHGDIKLDNYIVYPQTVAKRSTALKIIDWEFSGLGDPCWDVGSVFSSYLSFWLCSMPITGEIPPEEFLKLARYPLERIKEAIASFWISYVKQMELNRVEANACLLKSVRFAAARLLQTAYEITISSGQLTNHVICLVQLSSNILERPEQAIIHLLGIPSQ